MRGTRIEEGIEIYAENLAKKINCMSTNADKNFKNLLKYIVPTASTICGV
jgi:hypothetical protein